MARKLLLIDDSPSSLTSIAARLHAGGFEVASYSSPTQAIAAFDGSIAAVITDYEMPAKNGPAVCSAIRQNSAGSEVPIVVLTGKEDPAGILLAMQAGADDYLFKSLAPQLLAPKIEALIALKDLRQQQQKLDRLETIHQMVVTYNHEINNPLTIAMASLMQLQSRADGTPDLQLTRLQNALIRIQDVVKAIANLREIHAVDYAGDQKMINISKREA